MTEKEIKVFVNEFFNDISTSRPINKEELKEFLIKRSKENEDIKLMVRFQENKKKEALAKYKAVEKEYNEEMIKIQKECKHLCVTYYPDASGNSDSFNECDVCKKQAKNL